MIRVTRIAAPTPDRCDDAVVLDFDDRHRRRIVLTATRGLTFLLDLPQARLLQGGDILVLEDGRRVEVVAAAEPLTEVRGASPGDLIRLAWHLGNRHLPTEIGPRALRIRRDHVIEAMLQGLGATLRTIEAPFNPESGAYAAASGHSHDHGHEAHGGHHHHGHTHDP